MGTKLNPPSLGFTCQSNTVGWVLEGKGPHNGTLRIMCNTSQTSDLYEGVLQLKLFLFLPQNTQKLHFPQVISGITTVHDTLGGRDHGPEGGLPLALPNTRLSVLLQC